MFRPRRRAVEVCLFGVVILSTIAACASESERPILRIATDATFRPFHFVDDSGKPVGFDVELATELATRAGYDAQVQILAYDDLFAGISQGRHDVIAATTGITEERRTQYAFSDPYFETCQVAVVRSGSGEPKNLAELAELRVAAAGNGTAAAAMQSLNAVGSVRIEDGEGVPMLNAGQIDGWVVDEFDAVLVVRASQGELRVLSEPVAQEAYGLVFARDNQELVDAINTALAATQDDGFLQALRSAHSLDRPADWPVNCP